MLQKLSKSEVKAWLCLNLIILREIKIWQIQTVQMSFLAILEVLNFDFSKFEQLSSPKFTKNSKFRVPKIAKNDIFGPFESTKIRFHIKLEWQ